MSVSVNLGPCGEQFYDIMACIVLLLHSLLNGKEETGECRKTDLWIQCSWVFLDVFSIIIKYYSII